MLNIALPKGRMGDKVLKLFSQIALASWPWARTVASWWWKARTPGALSLGEAVRRGDYVERGAADIGVAARTR